SAASFGDVRETMAEATYALDSPYILWYYYQIITSIARATWEGNMPSAFAKKLAGIAQKQYDLYHFDSENDPPLAKQIGRYWTDLGLKFPGVSTAWSAVFVSWCVEEAGATSAEFKFNPAHSQFVYAAIQNGLHSTGVFRAFNVDSYAPQIGDIIQNNRGGNTF